MTEFSVAVADLARFCHRGGDIDHRMGPSPTGPEGIAGHRRLYTRRPPGYQPEHAVEYVHREGALAVTLRGRADGYDPEAGLVEEIKTCRVPPDSIGEHVAALHMAQGKLYAALIARRDALPGLRVRVTWLNIDSDEEYSRDEQMSASELGALLEQTLAQFSAWLARLGERRESRDASLDNLLFPYGEFRPGQRDIAELTYKCIDQGGRLLLEAPTGIGKTAAVLYPALKGLAAGKHERVVFATARTVGRHAAQDTLTRFREAGYRGSALSLTARETVCLSPGRACHGDDCPYARGYYDKLPAAREAAMARTTLAREDLEELAREHEVCPYELAADLLPWMDTVIADLHYLYSLGAGLDSAMAAGGERWSVLLDEAHNLPGRARRMYSARLARAALMRAKRETPGELGRSLQRVNRHLLALDKIDWQWPDYHSDEALPEKLVRAVETLVADVSAALGEEPALLQRSTALQDCYFDALQFLRVAAEWGPDFRMVLTRDGSTQGLAVTLNCLDPSRLLGARQERAHSVTAFSATLSPLAWTRDCLGLGADTVCTRAPSPFAPDQLEVSLATGTDTRYRARDRTLGELAALLKRWLEATPGNCIVYFPSYRYLGDCLELLGEIPGRTRWVQAREETEERRSQLLALLGERRDLAAFCILGGIFGEGIDLPGEQLASVVVVGVGMPQVGRETRELQAWYERETGAGFEYTFLYPGMQKVYQALGRVVRRPEDRGSALLIDPRYREPRYRELLPPWWTYRDWGAGQP